MYAKQPHRRRTLITSQEVTSRATSTHNLDPLTLQNAVEIAETRFLYPFLGGSFFTALAAAKNVVVTSDNIMHLQAAMDLETGTGPRVPLLPGDVVNAAEELTTDQQNLWYSHLWKYLAECVYLVALPSNYAQFSSTGIMKKNPIGSSLATEPATSVGVSLKDLQYLVDNSMMGILDPLRIALHDFLCANAALYPLYIGCPDGCGPGNVNGSKNTDWIDVYGTDVNCCDE